MRKSIQHHATPWFEAAILKNFEEFSTCVPWLVARSIYPNHSKSQSVHKDAWMVRIFATLSQEMFLPYLPYWSNCRGFGRTVPWGLQQQDAFGPFGLRDGKVRRRLHFDRRAKLHAALSKVCAEQVGWTLDSMSFFLFFIFTVCLLQMLQDSRLMQTKISQGSGPLLSKHKAPAGWSHSISRTFYHWETVGTDRHGRLQMGSRGWRDWPALAGKSSDDPSLRHWEARVDWCWLFQREIVGSWSSWVRLCRVELLASISYYVKLCQAMSWFQNVPKSMMITSRNGAS